MKARFIPVLAAILILVVAGSASVAASEADVPFYTSLHVQPEFAGDIPGGMVLDIPGEGQATHLGECTWDAVMRVHFRTPPAHNLQDGDMVFTAANGDELRGTFVGEGYPDENGVSQFEGTYQFDGGTGRFEHATGAGLYWGSAVRGDGVLYFDGTLNLNTGAR